LDNPEEAEAIETYLAIDVSIDTPGARSTLLLQSLLLFFNIVIIW
jgi:uncharacterized membrane protein